MIPINTTINTALYGIGIGYTPTNPFINVYDIRDPTPNDVNYPIQKRWINFALTKEWILENYTNVSGVTQAHWVLLTNAAGGVIQFTGGVGTSGFPVDPDGTGHVLLSSSDSSIVITGNNIAHSIDFKISGSGGVGVQQLTTDDPLVVTPAGSPGNINVIGNAVANATFSKPLFTHRTAATDTIILEIQTASQQGAGAIQNAGIASFLNSQFTVNPATGFVQLKGSVNPPLLGLIPDTSTPPGTSPVIADGSGDITLEGGATYATGTRTNPIRTNSLAANKMDFEIQLAGSDAFPGVANKFGVAQFDSTQFTVTNGFVQVNSSGPITETLTVDGFVAPAITNVVAPSSNNITINGALVAAGTNPVQTISHNNAQFNVQVQTSQALAAQDSTKVGLCNFDSANFNVSAQGFVTFTGTTPFNPNATVQLVDDFIGANNGISVSGPAVAGVMGSNYIWSMPGSGLWQLNNLTHENGHPGIIGTGGLGPPTFVEIFLTICTGGPPYPPFPQFVLGGGVLTVNWVFKIGTLSTGTNRYIWRFGMGDTSRADQANGVYFEYSDNINGGQWVYKTANGGVRTTTNSSTLVTTGWHNAQITVNAAGSSVSFVMDGVSLGAAIVTNIPTVNPIIPFAQQNVTLGVTAFQTLLIDLFYLNQTLTTPR